MKLFILMALCLISLAVPSMAAPWYGKGIGNRIGSLFGRGGHGGGEHGGGKGGGVTVQGPDIVFQFDPLDEVYANDIANDPVDMYYI
ncbi:uncharacterized protein LOC133842478 isoform X3 [Drosophila sulfurigaster albostrigata]|uniref:uncharacterized protein LOC133842478 isoform X2 n=1 Tax=Drosophila sulfurigaster albostrigata TaxID=89887 RepID=UPI002D21892A|nr:uncharacterized protein LOC133842478 isoform X2 [Drosophila sulfurigaster albostrigata]XP_062131560.1 uncharacterized protein LOC133842478 isoform X3 [Drosophila sulfurigaster albostrigata]